MRAIVFAALMRCTNSILADPRLNISLGIARSMTANPLDTKRKWKFQWKKSRLAANFIDD